MEKENYFLIAILIIAVAGLAFASIGFFKKTDAVSESKSAVNSNSGNENLNKNSNNEGMGYETKSSESDVTIDLTPKKFENGKLYIDISVNTHTVDLEQFDLTKIVKLEYDKTSLFPESAPKLSGHHNSGTLIFNAQKEIKKFKIIIKGIPGIEERQFEW
ncbi:hypothetical protein HYX01_00155 [Candidatus Woesearchaeota archaeon]|nr:hypothetical protein [Candidatus Woesearchaeota archaeon]